MIFFSFNVKEQSKMFNIILHFTRRKTLMSETMDHLLLKIKMISNNVLFLLVEARTLYYCLTVVNLSWLRCICKKFVFTDEATWPKKVQFIIFFEVYWLYIYMVVFHYILHRIVEQRIFRDTLFNL